MALHSLIERSNIKNERFYILQTEISYPYFQEHIQKFGGAPQVPAAVAPEEELLKQAFDYLCDQLAATEKAINDQANLSETKKKLKLMI